MCGGLIKETSASQECPPLTSLALGPFPEVVELAQGWRHKPLAKETSLGVTLVRKKLHPPPCCHQMRYNPLCTYGVAIIIIIVIIIKMFTVVLFDRLLYVSTRESCQSDLGQAAVFYLMLLHYKYYCNRCAQ